MQDEQGWRQRGKRRGKKAGAGHCPGDASTPVCQLPGPISCWTVTLSFLGLHTRELEDEGLLPTERVVLATRGRMQVVSLVTPGKPACRDGEDLSGQQSGWMARAEAGQATEGLGL